MGSSPVRLSKKPRSATSTTTGTTGNALFPDPDLNPDSDTDTDADEDPEPDPEPEPEPDPGPPDSPAQSSVVNDLAPSEKQVLAALKNAIEHPEDSAAQVQSILLKNLFEKSLFHCQARNIHKATSKISSPVWTSGYMQQVMLSEKGIKKAKTRNGTYSLPTYLPIIAAIILLTMQLIVTSQPQNTGRYLK